MAVKKNTENGRIFQWDISKLNNFIRETDNDIAVQISIQEIKKQEQALGCAPKVLEAGCGNGRVIVYLNQHGIKNVCGVEANEDITAEFNRNFPQFDVRNGDIMNLPEDLKNHDVVLSYGVVEHFLDGPSRPLAQMCKDLADTGTAIVTVPFLSIFRKIKYLMYEKRKWDKNKYKYCPEFDDEGDFYMYLMTKKEFENELKNAGFEIVKHAYTAPDCGTLEALNHHNVTGRFLWRDENRHFHFTPCGKLLFFIMKHMPWCFAHMQLCVCKKRLDDK